MVCALLEKLLIQIAESAPNAVIATCSQGRIQESEEGVLPHPFP